ncbi:DUF2442 domain-containing protein [Desulfobacterium sp. N47]|uniref:DUF2442 domain-containing protein n=1 Tax=uncultured Desulfobacterium sp. TaxID=201089 RepID=E1YM01_9BACT|nr:hypothetical protein N47_E46460 [uncultured Desulfobacterium sp.]
MKKHHNIKNLRFKDKRLFLTINGEEKSFPLHDISYLLEKASDEERNTFEISPSGYGIHWPLLDEDISIDGLLKITHSPSQKKLVATS